MQYNLEREQENLKKRHNEILDNLHKELENEKRNRKEKLAMQLSKYMKSGQSFEEMDENEEKKELAVIFFLNNFFNFWN